MRTKRTISEKVIAANRINGTKTPGPATQRGKERSRLNARKLGLYCQELLISAKDAKDFEQLRWKLSRYLKVDTPLEEIARDRIIACTCRCKLALHQESERSAGQLAGVDSDSSSDQPATALTQPWTTSREASRNTVRMLLKFRADNDEYCLLHQDSWRDQLLRGVGQEFWDTLTVWRPSASIEAIRLADTLMYQMKTYKMPLPPKLLPTEGVKVISDPKLQLQMMKKLIDLKIQSINEARGMQIGQPQTAEHVESVYRVFPACCRDLERAVAWYKSLREAEE